MDGHAGPHGGTDKHYFNYKGVQFGFIPQFDRIRDADGINPSINIKLINYTSDLRKKLEQLSNDERQDLATAIYDAYNAHHNWPNTFSELTASKNQSWMLLLSCEYAPSNIARCPEDIFHLPPSAIFAATAV